MRSTRRYGVVQGQVRALGAAVALVAIIVNGPASGAPADIASGLTSAPSVTAEAPKAKELGDGDASVSTQTGNLTYSYPIGSPPGRGKAKASLALTYSSTAPLYGGVAAGWALSGVPGVYEDTSGGRMRTRHPMYQFTDPLNDDRFVSTLVGGRKLIMVSEPKDTNVWATYRANYDGAYTRFDRMFKDLFTQFYWRARTSDGMTYEFGGIGATSACGALIGWDYAPLTLAKDAFGNTVRYSYQLANGECRLSTVIYGANSNLPVAEAPDFASITFTYAAPLTCNGVATGSHTDYRTGTKIVTGTSRLTTITSRAIAPGTGQIVHTRTIALGYDGTSESCNAQHSPVRLLTSITESASGLDPALAVTLPAVTFTYGAPAVPFNDQKSGSSNGLQALSWGKRFPGDIWPTLDGTLVDLDGDGLLDKVVSQTTGGQCQAVWQRNTGLGSTGVPGWGTPHTIDLPLIPWANAISPAFGFGTPNPANESCSLNGQRTQYHNMIGGPESYLAYRWLDMNSDGLTDLVAAIHHSPTFYDLEKPNEPFDAPLGEWPSCSGEGVPDACKAKESTCLNNCWGDLSFDWSCGAACVAQAEPVPCAEHMAPAPPGQPSHALVANMMRPSRRAYERCDLYPWAIYYNLGNGQIDSIPLIKYYPKPLDSETSNAAITGNHFVNETDANMDIDGDGAIDVVVVDKTPTPATLPFYWTAWLGNARKAGVDPQEYQVLTRADASPHRTDEVIDPATGDKEIQPVQGVMDLNTDGLQDQWLRSGAINSVRLHDGLGYPNYTAVYPPEGVRLGTHGWLDVTWWNLGQTWAITADRWTRDRSVDADADGRIDVLNTDGTAPVTPGAARLHLNVGGNYHDYIPYPSSTSLADIRGKVTAEGNETSNSWYHRADFADLDNDGITEFVRIEGSTMMRTVHTRTSDAPPRLMRTINNGRGATTTVTYDSMNRTWPAGSATVIQGPAEPNHRASPRGGWVVQSMSTTDEAASPNTTTATTYLYKHPRYLNDEEAPKPQEPFAFRGFDEVTTTMQSGAKTIQRYSYSPDWSGRLADTLVLDAGGNVQSIESTSWQTFTTFVGSWIQAFHPTQTRSRICANGQNEAQCMASPAGYTQTTSTWSAIAEPGSPGTGRLFAVTETLLQAQPGISLVDGDRKHTTSYALVSDASNYRLVTTGESRFHQESGAFVLFGKTGRVWDATKRFAEKDLVWFDGSNSECHDGEDPGFPASPWCAVTRRRYDPITGNVLQVWKPKQWAADPNIASNTVATSYVYDSRKLFVASETNERGHVLDHLYEYGTGTRLETRGPNAPTCSPSCPAGTEIKETQRIKVDGLGRMIERYETFSETGGEYPIHKVETNVYFDAYLTTPPVRPSVTHQSAIDYVATRNPPIRYTEDKTELDGHGRPVKTIVAHKNAAAADQITTYAYRDDGTLSSVTVPNPMTNDTSTVTYSYTFDSLGRPLTIRRPDGEDTGVNLSYSGLTVTSTEHLGSATGNAAVTETTKDAFGRLIQVVETNTPDPASTTTYDYAPDDSVATIVDAEGVTTSLEHDFAGRRTTVTRNARVWTYGYDKNGNLESEQTPCSGEASCLAHTTSIVYDELDRPVSKEIAPRTLTTADQALFGSSETFTWDIGVNAKGRMNLWQSRAPNNDVITSISPTYNLQGQPRNLSQTTNAAGYVNLNRTFLREHNLAGAPTSTYYRDVVGTQNCTSGSYSLHTYDNRGLPYQVQALQCLYTGGTPYSFVRNTRNVAGLVTRRHSIAGIGTITHAESNWTYDELGRVESQEVLQGTAPTQAQVARQELKYNGNDDPEWMKHWLGTSNLKHFVFGYDFRHQLKTVAEDALPDAFTAAYTYLPSGRFDSALESAASLPNGDVTPRNVEYVYSLTDPERLLKLKKSQGNKNLAEYTYDDGGSQLSRYYPDSKERWEYVYDGKSQLRRVTKKVNGSVQGSEEYWYDGGGARYLVVKRDASGTKTGAIWFIGETEAHYSATGTVTRAFGHVSMGTPVLRIDRSTDAASILEYQFHGLGDNALATIDQVSGTINASFVYAPFGEIIEATNGGGATNGLTAHARRMNDKFVDAVSGLAYYGARYYDKLAMSWTQADPLYTALPDLSMLGSPRRANLYQFTLSNPLRYIDPDGLDARPSLSSYTTEGEQRNSYRAALEADANWEVNKGHCSWNTNACSFIVNQDNRGAWTQDNRGAWAQDNRGPWALAAWLRDWGPRVVEERNSLADLVAGATPAQVINFNPRGDIYWQHDAELAELRRLIRSRLHFVAPTGGWKAAAWGHTFKRHGAGAKNTEKLKGRAAGTRTPQGQWLNNEQAAKLLQGYPVVAPAYVALPPGVGQIIMPSGSVVPATWAIIVPMPGGVRVAYPAPAPF